MRNSAIIIAAASALALSACGSERSGTYTTEDGETGEYTIDTDSGEATMTIESPDGDAFMRSGADVEPNLPDGWSIYPGAQVQNSINVDGPDGGGTMVTMMTDATPDEVTAFYREQAEDTGFSIEMEISTGGAKIIGGQSEEDATFSVTVSPNEDGGQSTVQLMVGKGG